MIFYVVPALEDKLRSVSIERRSASDWSGMALNVCEATKSEPSILSSAQPHRGQPVKNRHQPLRDTKIVFVCLDLKFPASRSILSHVQILKRRRPSSNDVETDFPRLGSGKAKGDSFLGTSCWGFSVETRGSQARLYNYTPCLISTPST